MNNTQKAALYAGDYFNPHGTTEEQKLWKIVVDAVLHGIEIGIEGFDANLRKELAEGFVLTLNEEGGLSFVKPKDLDL